MSTGPGKSGGERAAVQTLREAGGGFGNRVRDRPVERRLVHGRRQIRFEDGDLRRFLVDQIRASAFRELLDRVPALFDRSPENRLGFLARQLSLRGNPLVLEGREQEPQGRDATLVAGFHRALQILLDTRLHRAEGLPIKAIARLLGVSKNTVKAAIASSGPPRYERARRGSIMDEVEPRLHELLA